MIFGVGFCFIRVGFRAVFGKITAFPVELPAVRTHHKFPPLPPTHNPNCDTKPIYVKVAGASIACMTKVIMAAQSRELALFRLLNEKWYYASHSRIDSSLPIAICIAALVQHLLHHLLLQGDFYPLSSYSNVGEWAPSKAAGNWW